MEKVIDTMTEENPDIVGETLREFVWGNEEEGCYMTFDPTVPDNWEEVSPKELTLHQLESILGYCIYEEGCLEEGLDRLTVLKYKSPFSLLVAWHWDGDGTLYFNEAGRETINYDCKKNYGWEFIEK